MYCTLNNYSKELTVSSTALTEMRARIYIHCRVLTFISSFEPPSARDVHMKSKLNKSFN